ncbi:MAG: maleylacetoacetate isomerase [Pseudomonadota bacterium]
MNNPIALYTYWRSSAAYRVRIALNLKGLEWRAVPVSLVRDGGEQRKPAYRELNPQGLVPTLRYGDDVLTQSLAIVEYLDERHPAPPLLPADPLGRSRVRALALSIACDVHPLNNLRVMKYLKESCGQSDGDVARWYAHWIAEGFAALEAELANGGTSGRFCYGDEPTLVDCCLVPQVYNARRFDCDLRPYPTLRRIDEACLELEAFRRAEPSVQADAS